MTQSLLTAFFKPLAERLGKRFDKWFVTSTEPESMADRFFRLFESHGVTRQQIPRFIPNLGFSDVSSAESLINALGDQEIVETCEVFGVDREWLEGAQPRIYQHRSFYKNITGLSRFLDEQEIDSKNWGALYAVREKDTSIQRAQTQQEDMQVALVFSKLTKELSSEQVVYRYFPLADGGSWSYGGSRMYFSAVFRLASDRNLICRGIEVSKVNFKKLENLEAIPQAVFDRQLGSWDIYRLVMTDDEIPKWKEFCQEDLSRIFQHRDSD